MEVFEFSYVGLWLGGEMIVIAKDLKQAKKLAKAELVSQVDIDSLELRGRRKIETEPFVFYNEVGDY